MTILIIKKHGNRSRDCGFVVYVHYNVELTFYYNYRGTNSENCLH